MDWDFPAPAPAKPEPKPQINLPRVPDFIVDQCLIHLGAFAKQDPEAVAWACYDWLQINQAGLPVLPLVDGAAREDARFWAETAHPAELECYALAAIDRLGGMGGIGSGGYALFASRQIKRLAGALFKRMSPSEQAAFSKWIKEQTNERG
jgi:hypothetical protein